MNLVDGFNLIEAGIWAVFAILTASFGGRVAGMTPRLKTVLAVSFLAFGVSDLIELSTGAWWRPPGLLIYKGACLISIAACSLVLRRNRLALVQPAADSSEPAEASPPDSP